MNFKQMIQSMDQETYIKLKRAVEIGKWEDGTQLTSEQRELSLQAVIAFEIEQNMDDTQRTGYVDTEKSTCHSGDTPLDNLEKNDPSPMKWHS
ncbi:MAG: DUF1315 family protein [Cellvibrionales bacterium]|nr:DUF1315 family protein [Cellvibrionales bacterium]